VSGTLEVIECEDVLQLGLVVHDRTTALLLSLLKQVNQELLNVLGLLVAYDGRQVLKRLYFNSKYVPRRAQEFYAF